MIAKLFAVLSAVVGAVITVAISIAGNLDFWTSVIVAIVIGGISGYYIGGRHSAPRLHLHDDEDVTPPERNRWLRIFD